MPAGRVPRLQIVDDRRQFAIKTLILQDFDLHSSMFKSKFDCRLFSMMIQRLFLSLKNSPDADTLSLIQDRLVRNSISLLYEDNTLSIHLSNIWSST